jgi:hypothetical protein
MTPDEAAQRLIAHSMPGSGSFLGMLRPYRGIDAAVLGDLLACLRECAPLLQSEKVPRELVGAIVAITELGRRWALHPNGMLRRNGLISDEDAARVADTIEQFGYAALVLLDAGDVETAFEGDSLPLR